MTRAGRCFVIDSSFGPNAAVDDTSAAARDRKIPPKARALARGLRGLIPGLSPQPAFAWAGTFAETPDGYGYVQPSRRTPGVVLALACGGNGMAFAPIAARLVSAWREGRDDPDASLFRFNRGRVERRS